MYTWANPSSVLATPSRGLFTNIKWEIRFYKELMRVGNYDRTFLTRYVFPHLGPSIVFAYPIAFVFTYWISLLLFILL